MKKGVLNIKVDYKPLDTYKNVTVRSGSNRQNYNANTRYFEPDRRIDPYVVLIECGVNDVHNIVSGLVNANLTDVSWKQSTPTGYKPILSTDTEFKIGTGADKGKLSIFKNVSEIEPITILFSARFIDATTKRVVNFQESLNLITLPIAESPLLLETSAPVGYNLFPTENNQGLICQADLYRGIDKVSAAYWWYKGNTLLTDTEGYSGTAKNKLFVPASALSKAGDVFKCEVADCSNYLNGLVSQKVEADAQVVEWRGLYQGEEKNLFGSNTVNFKGNGNPWTSYTGLTRKTQDGELLVTTDSTSNPRLRSVSSQDMVVFSSINEEYLIEIIYKSSAYILSLDGKASTLTTEVNEAGGQVIGTTSLLSNSMMEDGYRRTVFKYRSMIATETAKAGWFLFALPKNTVFLIRSFKLQRNVGENVKWSPNTQDLRDMIDEKTEYYKLNTSLPDNYRPNPKPAKLYKADFMLMKKMPGYVEEVLYPTSVSPEASSVQVEMVLNTNNGVIQRPEQFLSVGWLKQSDGTFKYKGFKVNISIADIKALNEANKQLDYELREDLTLKP